MGSLIIKKVKLKDIDKDNFYKHFLSEQYPVLITDIYEEFPELKSWNMEYLVKKVGSKQIKINTSNSGVFALNPKTGKQDTTSLHMTVKDYINIINTESTEGKMYAQQISILNTLPELQKELNIMKYIPDQDLKSVNIWFGSGGNTSLLHYDPANNFFLQLLGEKKMWLCSPKYFSSLYPNSWRSDGCYLSKINPYNYDNIEYPEISKIEKTELLIPCGSILFLPAYWWHQVYSITNSISVNIWFKIGFRQKLVPAHYHYSLNRAWNFLKNMLSGINNREKSNNY